MMESCRLCGRFDELRDSHLMPKAFYKLARQSGDVNPNPIVVFGGIARKTPAQVRDALLCQQCEHRFNVRGERWVIENGWRGEGRFPLLTKLRAATPAQQLPDFTMYEKAAVSRVQIEQLVYFAVSVFWRTAVHDWPGANRIDLGGAEHEFRRYLLDEAPWPVDAVLQIVSDSRASEQNAVLFLSSPYDHAPDVRGYKCWVPGIMFQLLVGDIPSNLRTLCAASSPHGYICCGDLLRDLTTSPEIQDTLHRAREIGNLR